MPNESNFNRQFAVRSVGCYLLCIVLALVAVFRVVVINKTMANKISGTPLNSVSFNYGDTRGNFYDAYGFPLTNETKEYLAVITPTSNAIRRLNTFYNLEDRKIILEGLKSKKPILYKADTLINIDNIYGFEYTNRYTNNSLLRHLIGYIDAENKGVYGLEKSYDDILYSNNSLTVSLATNAKGEILQNSALEFYGKQNTNSVYLTIDKRIQKIAEDAAIPLNKGAIIIAETQSGKIRAMVSKPNFNQNSIAKSLNDNNSPLINRALLSYNVGSAFKPCVAAAAIKDGLKDYEYICSGSCVINGYIFNCHKKSGHGKMNLKTAIANSCNTYFYNLAQEINKTTLYNTAVSFGFASNEAIAKNLNTSNCNLSSIEELNSSKRLVANFSIGQGNLLISPISMLNLYNSIANNGNYVKPYVVEKTVVNGKTNKTATTEVSTFDEATATILREALLEVVESGTGKLAKSESVLLAGKTATAETGWLINGETAVHSWFCGFFPYHNPQYTVIVFAENSDITGSTTAEIFKNIAESMKKAGLTT